MYVGTKRNWDGQERDAVDTERFPSNAAGSSKTATSSPGGSNLVTHSSGLTSSGGTTNSNRYGSSPQPDGDRSSSVGSGGSHGHSHSHHGHGSSSGAPNSHHSGSGASRRISSQHSIRESPLMRTAKRGDCLTLKMLLKDGSDVNEQDVNGE